MTTDQIRIVYAEHCLECGSTTERRATTLHYEVEDFTIEVENVPASVCPNCGEKYIPGDVGLIVHRQVRDFVEHAKTNRVTRGSVVISFEIPELESQRNTA